MKSIGSLPTTLFGVSSSVPPRAKKAKTSSESTRVCVFYKKGVFAYMMLYGVL